MPPKSTPPLGPEFIEPMLLKLVQKLPVGEIWSYELKLDGYRGIAIIKSKEVQADRQKDASTTGLGSVSEY